MTAEKYKDSYKKKQWSPLSKMRKRGKEIMTAE
jgi:hypothetical protein